MKVWNERDLVGEWDITIKVDGVNATSRGGKVWSRADKPLYNTDHLSDHFEVAEIFCGSLKNTLAIVRASKNPPRLVKAHEIFHLEPVVDKRLFVCTAINPTAEFIKQIFEEVLDNGHEGLVLRGPDGERLKYKPKKTYDVIILDIFKGTPGKKHEHRLGGFLTTKGRVTGGFTDQQREEFDTPDVIGKLVEVECMQLTPDGKFRHARFIRFRDDKPAAEADR